MNIKKIEPLAPVILRLSLASVFIWFGSSQLANSDMWTSNVPDWAINLSGLNELNIVRINAIFEIVAGILLVLGLAVRITALLLSLHLFVIASEFGLNPTGVRDFGLAASTLALSLFGSDQYCLGYKKEKSQ